MTQEQVNKRISNLYAYSGNSELNIVRLLKQEGATKEQIKRGFIELGKSEPYAESLLIVLS